MLNLIPPQLAGLIVNDNGVTRIDPDKRIKLKTNPCFRIVPADRHPLDIMRPLTLQGDSSLLVQIAELFELGFEVLKLRRKFDAAFRLDERFPCVMDARASFICMLRFAGGKGALRFGDLVDVLELGPEFALLKDLQAAVAPRPNGRDRDDRLAHCVP